MNPPFSERPRWGTSLALVLAAYATLGIVTGLWLRPFDPPRDEGNMQALMVELAPLPTAPPAAPAELPPGPPQQAQQAQPKPAPKPPEPESPPLPDSTPEVEDPYQTTPEETAEDSAQEQAAIAHTSAPPSVDATPGADYAAPQSVSGQARQQAVASWQGLLLGHLEKYRRYPRNAQRLRQQGVTQVRFSVDRQGRVSNPRIGRSSGHHLLDEETLATLQRASPLPPPPPEIRGDPVEVMVPVSFFIRR